MKLRLLLDKVPHVAHVDGKFVDAYVVFAFIPLVTLINGFDKVHHWLCNVLLKHKTDHNFASKLIPEDLECSDLVFSRSAVVLNEFEFHLQNVDFFFRSNDCGLLRLFGVNEENIVDIFVVVRVHFDVNCLLSILREFDLWHWHVV